MVASTSHAASFNLRHIRDFIMSNYELAIAVAIVFTTVLTFWYLWGGDITDKLKNDFSLSDEVKDWICSGEYEKLQNKETYPEDNGLPSDEMLEKIAEIIPQNKNMSDWETLK